MPPSSVAVIDDCSDFCLYQSGTASDQELSVSELVELQYNSE
jgi:hypothetical protein